MAAQAAQAVLVESDVYRLSLQLSVTVAQAQLVETISVSQAMLAVAQAQLVEAISVSQATLAVAQVLVLAVLLAVVQHVKALDHV